MSVTRQASHLQVIECEPWRTRKAYQAVSRDARRAYLNATSDERMTLDQLAIVCQARAITPDEAHQCIAAIRNSQRDRQQQAA